MVPLRKITLEEQRHNYKLAREFQRKYCGEGGVGNTWDYEGGDDEEEMHIRRRWYGFCGGMLLAEHLSLPWHEGNMDTWNTRHSYGDVGDIDVRTRSSHWHELSTRTMDSRPLVLVKPKVDWDIKAENWYELPDLFVCGFHLPWYISRYGKPLGKKGVFALPDSFLIPMEYLNGRIPRNST